MAARTTETTITFRHPFSLSSLDHEQPGGTYRLVTDEEEVPGLSFLVYRRAATMLQTPAISVPTGIRQVFLVSSEELATALEADALV